MKKKTKTIAVLLAAVMAVTAIGFTGCAGDGVGSTSSASSSSSDSKVVIYCNSDDEAVQVMKDTLDANGYKGKYTFQTFGTSELGGKMMAEGKNLECDMLAMSSFYIDSAQKKYDMFTDLSIDKKTQKTYGSYYTPMLANQGAIFYNTKLIKQEKLPVPKSLKDLAKSEYAGEISVPDISGSSTAWLMIQALISEYGEDGTKTILKAIYKNAGDNLEDSGSGPIKKVLAGECAIGFGLRHQAVMDKENGDPIDYVDPTEGDFTLTEGFAVLNHGDKTKEKLANDMANCIITKGRAAMMKYYPIALYQGETTNKKHIAANSKEFSEPLTVDLLKKHIALSESCK